MSSWSRALDELVRERGAALFGYAYVLTGNAADAEDLVQSALVRTFRSGKATRGIDTTHAYVKRAIASAFVDGGRRAKARPQRQHGDAGDLGGAEHVAPTSDPSDSVAASLDFHAALLTLPPRERACVVLRYLEDRPVAGVAAELNLATGTVKRYLADATAKLRVALADVEFPEEPGVTVLTHHDAGGSR
ncbi:sigma-70 family RNA polymerase sigma factor [Demequina sp. TTPB684]|uniref:RNA polymerase sigma factor n=1 Tax=unclassified Demequina TaxID=2620311 RepID=UPI001CF203E3|nr:MULTISPECIES: sigma-70 family RNA polymerase sigma factor [unclassified Demequina]MCB2413482.1 sigma-70 family RNA polymerase sigma factor [Demequina sp. TTPB684]UPU88784.1 sigma-70 family RNA polymerase sigma factor [Demequina sp. TMPB413]